METIGSEDVTDREATTTDEMVTAEIVQMPTISAQRPMEPDRVIEAGEKETFHAGLVVGIVHDL